MVQRTAGDCVEADAAMLPGRCGTRAAAVAGIGTAMILVASDLHQGSGAASDHANYPGIAAFIDSIQPGVSHVVKLGDWLETWRCRLRDTIAHNEPLLRREALQVNAAGAELVWVLGNHDWVDLTTAEAVLRDHGFRRFRVEPQQAEINGWTFVHGNDWDEWNRTPPTRWTRVARAVTCAVGLIERRVDRGFDDRRINPQQWISPAYSDDLAHPIHARALRWASGHGSHLVFGHTHRPFLHEGHGYALMNTGCLVRDTATWAALRAGAASLIRWTDASGYQEIAAGSGAAR